MRWRRARPAPAPTKPAGPSVRQSVSVAFFVPATPRCQIEVRPTLNGIVVSVVSTEKTAAAASAGLKNALHVLEHYTREALVELAEDRPPFTRKDK